MVSSNKHVEVVVVKILTDGMSVVSFVLIKVEKHISKVVMYMIIMRPTACIKTTMLTKFGSILTMVFVIIFMNARAMWRWTMLMVQRDMLQDSAVVLR